MLNKELQDKIKNYLVESVKSLKELDLGCCTYKLDDRLAICVGWEPGFGEEERDDVIQSESNLDYAIVAAIKVWTSDDMRTDLEYINSPYYKDGDVLDYDLSIEPDDDYDNMAEYFLDRYDEIKDLEITKDGCIIEKPID